MAPIKLFARATKAVLQRRTPGNDIIAATLFGLGFFLVIVAYIGLRCIAPCTLIKRETLLARQRDREARRNAAAEDANQGGDGGEVAVEAEKPVSDTTTTTGGTTEITTVTWSVTSSSE